MKKRHITLISFLVICFIYLIAQSNAQDLRIDVQVERVGNLELLPIDLHVMLWNISSNSLLLPKDIDENFANYFQIAVDSTTKIDTRCSRIQRVLHTQGAMLTKESPFFELAPGKSYSLSIIGYVSIANHSPWNEKRKEIFQFSIEGSKQLAKWKIEKGHAIISLHPDFKYVDNMKLAIVLNHLALGETEEGLNELNDLIKNGKPDVSQWASKFRDLWLAKHPLPSLKTKNK